ncbi:MAG: hypothetical protein M3Q58_06810 [Bacteroidota bacterium]|nr:hypothetical protein [Bacteroidota bacterium]
MARQNGILKIEGTIQDLTFYKTKDGHLVKTKSSISKERIANDPAFVRTRENGSEFGSSATSGKLTRDALRIIAMSASDNRIVSRLTQLMTKIKNMDMISARGLRNVDEGINTVSGKALLKGFEFNKNALLGSILFKPYSLNTATGEITINGLVPVNDIVWPQGATHISLTGAFANIDYAAGTSEIELSNVQNMLIDGVSANISLLPTAVPVGVGIKVFLLKIEFFQMVNAVQYSLKNGAYNALRVIDVV